MHPAPAFRHGDRALLEALTERHEARVEHGEPWTMAKMSVQRKTQMLKSIVGFEMEISAWRDTVKLSQNKSDAERDHLVAGLQAEGSTAMATLMRTLVPAGQSA